MESDQDLDKMAAEILEVDRLVAMLRARRPATGSTELSEAEYLSLDAIAREDRLTIGDVQKRIGVLPAQMSRIVRSLEEQGGKGYVACNINAKDRRRIDITLTEAGRNAYENYRHAKLGSMRQVLGLLPPEDQVHFMRIVRRIRDGFEHMVLGKKS